jgi:hypothetical protein
MTSQNAEHQQRTGILRRAVVIALAGATLGVTGAVAVAVAQDDDPSVVACTASGADLRRAADAARQLESERPDLFRQSPRPAGHDDLRLAAEWSDRMAELDPDGRAECTRP